MFFDDHQRETVAAAMARIIPTDDEPGAREAGTIDFLDRYLSGLDYVFAKPDGSGFETLEGRRADAWRQRIDILQRKYTEGVEELDRRSQESFGSRFVNLEPEQQDRVLSQLEHPDGAADSGEASSASPTVPTEPALQQTNAEIDLSFFALLCTHTRQGFYADPIYGGNRDRVGWRVIGFPGPTSLADVHSGRYSTLAYFVGGEGDPRQEG